MKNKKLPPAYLAVKWEWTGSFTRLAEHLQKSKSNISQTLRKTRIHYNNRILLTQAINEVFSRQYEVDELFPITK